MLLGSDNPCSLARRAICDGFPRDRRLARSTTQTLPVAMRNGAATAGKAIPSRPSLLVSGRPRDLRRLQIRPRSWRREALWIACHMLCGTGIALVLAGLFPSLGTSPRQAEHACYHDSDPLGTRTTGRLARSDVPIRTARANEMVALAGEASPP